MNKTVIANEMQRSPPVYWGSMIRLPHFVRNDGVLLSHPFDWSPIVRRLI